MTWTWANLLTAIRALTIAPIVALMFAGRWGWASVLFTVAAITDYYDGRLARRFNQASALGGVADHATDALFVTVCTWACASMGMLPMLLSVMIAAAFVQYVLDSKALAGQSLRASQLGRYNGIAYFVIVGVVVIAHGVGLWPWLATATYWCGWLLVATSAISMADRAATYLRLRSARKPSA